MAQRKGIDVSYAQKSIDWAKVKASGVEFAIIRAGYGSADYGTDTRLKENAAGAAENGIPCGFYHYSYSQTPAQAKSEAAMFLERVAGQKPEYPLWMDFEERVQTNLEISLQMDTIESFLTEIEAAGYYAGLYSYRAELEALLAAFPARVGKYDIWTAQWGLRDRYSGAHGMWQYSACGDVDGINGPVDMDIAYLDYPAIIRAAGMNGFTAEKPQPAPEKPAAPVPGTPEESAALAALSAERDALAEKLAKIAEIAKITN